MSSAAALAVHVGVVLAIPDAPVERAVVGANSVWFSAASSASLQATGEGQEAAATRASAPAAERGKGHAVTRRTRLARRSVAVPVAAPPEVQEAEQRAGAHPPAFNSDHTPEDGGESTAGGTTATAADRGAPADGIAGGNSGAGSRGRANGSGRAGALPHGPSLLASSNPCRGFFPAAARVDHAAIRISVEVDSAGRTRASRVLAESPAAQEFRIAARACAAALRFVPAADFDGAPIAGVAKLELRFDRS